MAKFLVLVRAVPGKTPQPHVQGRKQKFAKAYKDSKNWAKQSKQSGRTKEIYAVTQNNSGIVGAALVEAGTAAEVMQDAHGFPLGPDFQYEVLPLTDFDQWMDHSAQQTEQVLA